VVAVALLALSFLLGGASRSHALRLMLVELASLPVLVIVARSLLHEPQRGHALANSIVLALIALPLLQLIPLPYGLWINIPGHEQPALALQFAGVSPGWSAISLTPDLTWRALLALAPPVAMYFATTALGPGHFGRLVAICLLAGGANAALCVVQLATSDPRYYAWAWSDLGLAVGFFANSNHMAALGTSTLPFAAAIAVSAARCGLSGRRALWSALAYLGVMVVVIAAGLLIGAISLVGSVLVARAGLGRPRLSAKLLGAAAGCTVAALAIVSVSLAPMVSENGLFDVTEGRLQNWPLVAEAAQTYLPVGSGIGSFDAIFRSVEPLETLRPTYFNEAHNEYLQIWLEAGWLGVALVIAFLVWFGRRSQRAWREGLSLEGDLQRAASVAIGLILLHSVVDYPLRTETMAVFFAICCGILEFAGRPRTENRPD
jgi:O-antigen ligase